MRYSNRDADKAAEGILTLIDGAMGTIVFLLGGCFLFALGFFSLLIYVILK